jgi:peptide/nickel transport system permease protein
LLREEMIGALSEVFVAAAASRGVPHWRVIWHAFRYAANPAISWVGVSVGGLLSGAVVVEKVFGWPGLGALTVDSILTRDVYVALNCIILSALLVVGGNLGADILLALNDPRVRRS